MTRCAALFLAALACTGLPAGAQETKPAAPAVAPAKPAAASSAGLTEVLSTDVQITGVAVSSTGRVFVCAPYWRQGHTWSVAEVVDGKLVEFPSGAYNHWVPGEGKRLGIGFVCVQSLYCDENDTLWVLDSGAPMMQGPISGEDAGGGPKVVRIDLKTNRVIRPYILGPQVVPSNGYPNDIRVDPKNNIAYITDSGAGGLILLDTRHGLTRRLDFDSPVLKADPAVVPMVGGHELKKTDGSSLVVHSDGIALDAAGGWLYVQALTSKKLHRLQTKPLQLILKGANDRLEERFKEATESLGETVVTDGIELGKNGNLYFTALERNAIMYRTPDGKMNTLVQADEISWPDSIAIHGDELYFTTSQIHLTDWFTPKASPKTPYKVYKVKLPAAK
jgi:sugar lactone lactonase YvrE